MAMPGGGWGGMEPCALAPRHRPVVTTSPGMDAQKRRVAAIPLAPLSYVWLLERLNTRNPAR